MPVTSFRLVSKMAWAGNSESSAIGLCRKLGRPGGTTVPCHGRPYEVILIVSRWRRWRMKDSSERSSWDAWQLRRENEHKEENDQSCYAERFDGDSLAIDRSFG